MSKMNKTFKDQLLEYFFIRKKGAPKEKKDINLKMMHGMNRISIFMFLIAVIIMLIRAFSKH